MHALRLLLLLLPAHTHRLQHSECTAAWGNKHSTNIYERAEGQGQLDGLDQYLYFSTASLSLGSLPAALSAS